jgi:hypothetical protein
MFIVQAWKRLSESGCLNYLPDPGLLAVPQQPPDFGVTINFIPAAPFGLLVIPVDTAIKNSSFERTAT